MRWRGRAAALLWSLGAAGAWESLNLSNAAGLTVIRAAEKEAASGEIASTRGGDFVWTARLNRVRSRLGADLTVRWKRAADFAK